MVGIPLRILLVIFKYFSLDAQLQTVCKFWLKAKSLYNKCMCAPHIPHNNIFENIHLLATGTFSNVYGINILKTRYALKRMEKVTQANLQNIRCVRREVKAHSVCYHPHVIQLYHIYQDASSLFMVEEYAPYGDLFDYSVNRNNRTLPEEFILSIFFQIASAVTYLHQSNILFRDLRLENVVLFDGCCVKLTDFGNSKFLLHRQKTYTLCGAPESCAPEMLCAKGYSQPIDWWALGVLLYELSVGYSPFYSENEMDTYARVLNLDLKTILTYKVSENAMRLPKNVFFVVELLLNLLPNLRNPWHSGNNKRSSHVDMKELEHNHHKVSLEIVMTQQVGGKHLSKLPKAFPFQHRMARIEWNRYCAEF